MNGASSTAPRVAEGTRVYAIGDIHGRTDLLLRLHDLIRADAKDVAERRKVVVYLGDYIDRGPDSRGVVDILTEEPLAGFESNHLRGNHDEWLVQFIDGTDEGLGWFINGGEQTLDSYGVVLPRLARFARNLGAAREQLLEALPDRHEAFFRGLELSHIEGDYFFVHAGIRPGIPLTHQEPEDLMWIRDEFLYSDEDHGKVVVHGHSPAPMVQVRENRIGIDTAAFATDRLTCLVLEADRRRFLNT